MHTNIEGKHWSCTAPVKSECCHILPLGTSVRNKTSSLLHSRVLTIFM